MLTAILRSTRVRTDKSLDTPDLRSRRNRRVRLANHAFLQLPALTAPGRSTRRRMRLQVLLGKRAADDTDKHPHDCDQKDTDQSVNNGAEHVDRRRALS